MAKSKTAEPRATIKYYLQNLETGQRYPVVNEDVVIGRVSGDIVLGEDTNLSNQHCRIVVTPEGLVIHDLGSANGTTVNGKKLEGRQLYPLSLDSVVAVGHQTFKLTEASRARPLKRRVKKKKKNKADPLARAHFVVAGLIAVAVALGVVLVTTRGHRPAAPPPRLIPAAPKAVPLETPLDLVAKDLTAVIESYRQLGHESEAEVNQNKLVLKIREDVVPALRLVEAKLGAIKPIDEAERRRLEVDQKMAAAMLAQLSAFSENAEHPSPKAAQAVETYAALLTRLNAEKKALDAQRAQGRR